MMPTSLFSFESFLTIGSGILKYLRTSRRTFLGNIDKSDLKSRQFTCSTWVLPCAFPSLVEEVRWTSYAVRTGAERPVSLDLLPRLLRLRVLDQGQPAAARHLLYLLAILTTKASSKNAQNASSQNDQTWLEDTWEIRSIKKQLRNQPCFAAPAQNTRHLPAKNCFLKTWVSAEVDNVLSR